MPYLYTVHKSKLQLKVLILTVHFPSLETNIITNFIYNFSIIHYSNTYYYFSYLNSVICNSMSCFYILFLGLNTY